MVLTGYNGNYIVCNGKELPLMVSTGNLSPFIGGLLNSLNPNGICLKTHYRKPFFSWLKVDGL